MSPRCPVSPASGPWRSSGRCGFGGRGWKWMFKESREFDGIRMLPRSWSMLKTWACLGRTTASCTSWEDYSLKIPQAVLLMCRFSSSMSNNPAKELMLTHVGFMTFNRSAQAKQIPRSLKKNNTAQRGRPGLAETCRCREVFPDVSILISFNLGRQPSEKSQAGRPRWPFA